MSQLDLGAATVAWALFDGAVPADSPQMQSGAEDGAPYASVLDAMRDGWRVMQLPSPPKAGAETAPGHLPHEYVLERMVPSHD